MPSGVLLCDGWACPTNLYSKISDMTSSHILNCIKFLERKKRSSSRRDSLSRLFNYRRTLQIEAFNQELAKRVPESGKHEPFEYAGGWMQVYETECLKCGHDCHDPVLEAYRKVGDLQRGDVEVRGAEMRKVCECCEEVVFLWNSEKRVKLRLKI